MTIRELLLEGSRIISLGGQSDSPWLDASVLLSKITELDRGRLLACLGDPVPSVLAEAANEILRDFLLACERRSEGLPIAYLTGKKEFFGREFLVDESVLIPRPETEILLEWVLETCHHPIANRNILDCFTGSGCIAISLALELGINIEGCDLSLEALANARTNSILHGCADLVNFQQADILEGLQVDFGQFDIITANPPYVPSLESRNALGRGWKEPLMALDGGPDGLEVIRRFLPQARTYLKPGGRIFMEFGDGQSRTLHELLLENGFSEIAIRSDLAGIPRIVCAG